jgi:hypothetical protein
VRTRGIELAALLLVACPSMATRQTADPTPPGRWQLLGSLDVVAFRDVEQETRLPGLQLELGARRGLVEDLDAGLKLHGFGVQGDVKWRFRRAPWAMALVPAVDLGWTPETGLTTDAIHGFGHLALLVSREIRSCLQVTFGPKAMAGVYWPETGGSAGGAWLGAFGSLDWRFSPRWHLVPEIDLYRSVAGEVPVRGGALQAGAGLLVDL